MEEIGGRIGGIFTKTINDLLDEGIIYLLVIIAVAIAIFIIYDRDNDDSKVFNSIARCFRRVIVLMADVASDIISILSSLTEILNLIRILVFGKIDSQTQIFLANYAVIFMSVVSYFTTMTGLKLVLGEWQAILASFGIQVGILVFAARLSRLVADKFVVDKRKQYVYRLKGDSPECKCDNGQEQCSKVFIKKETLNKENKEDEENKENEGNKRKGHGWIGTIIILALLMMCSSFFSYNAFWNKFVLPVVPLSEYADAQVSISEVEEEYSKSLKEYQQSLEEVLNRVNNTILENLDVNSIRILEAQIQKLKSDLEDVKEQIQETRNRMSEFETGSVERNEIEDGELKGYLDRQKDIEDDIAQAEGQLYSNNIYIVNEALSYLSGFYANPLNEEISIDDVESYWGNLQAGVAQIDKTKKLFTTEQRTDLDNILNNYLELCRYYRKNGIAEFKVKEQELIGFQEITDNEDTNGKYEKETRGMLQNVIESLEETPSFAAVNNIWDKTVIEEPSRTRLLERMYVVYRDIDGQPTEKAIRSLVSTIKFWSPNTAVAKRNTGIVLFVLIIAVFIDFTIVFISIWKGNKSTSRSFSELRRLVGILFIRKDKGRDEETRRMQLSVAFGLLFGVLMFVLQQLIPSLGQELGDKIYWLFFMYCACGLLAAIIIGKAIGRTHNLVNGNDDDKNTENNEGGELLGKDDKERVIEQYLMPAFIEIFNAMETKTICIINAETRMKEKEKSATCIKVEAVKEWKIEFSMLESYKIICTSEDNKYYILLDIFWKMLYTNILNKMSRNLVLPMSVEDLVNYEDTDENNS